MVDRLKAALLSGLISVLLMACEDGLFNPPPEGNFSGTFRSIDSDEEMSGQIHLQISRGRYSGTSNLSHGSGAGRLSVEGDIIHFQDTLFYPMLAIYGPSYVPSGRYRFAFDGKDLWLGRENNHRVTQYHLRLVR